MRSWLILLLAAVPARGEDATAVKAARAGPDSACPSDMVALPGPAGGTGFCIDRYEAPNQAGAKPFAFKTAPEGEAWCAAKGKRLCKESEWVRACRGPQMQDYPYGKTYKRGTCNDDKTWRTVDWGKLGKYPAQEALDHAASLYQAEASGARPACASSEGVMDLTGNVAEWVARDDPKAGAYPHVMKGCYWSGCYHGTPSCSFSNTAHPGTFRSYETGFRCCR